MVFVCHIFIYKVMFFLFPCWFYDGCRCKYVGDPINISAAICVHICIFFELIERIVSEIYRQRNKFYICQYPQNRGLPDLPTIYDSPMIFMKLN